MNIKEIKDVFVGGFSEIDKMDINQRIINDNISFFKRKEVSKDIILEYYYTLLEEFKVVYNEAVKKIEEDAKKV